MPHKKLALTSILPLMLLCSTLTPAQDATCSSGPFASPQLSPLHAPYQAIPEEPANALLLYSAASRVGSRDSLQEFTTASETTGAQPTIQPPDAHPSPETADATSSSDNSISAVVVHSVPIGPRKQPPKTIRPFSTFAIAFKADTLGAGIDLATPLSRSFNLRASVNIFAFGYPFNIDGVDYNAQLRFRSGQLSLDWFPEHGGFHISPGLLYFRNDLSSLAAVPAGQYFELGSQGFINSVDDPVNGTASVTYPRSIAPTLMVGFSNIIPRSGRHLSMPYELGVAYTGTPRVHVALNGTACTFEGCFDMSTNPETQQSLAKEVDKLNKDLKYLPLYPIVSIGLAYRF